MGGSALVAGTVSLAVSLVLLAYFLWNQLRVRRVSSRLTLPVLLIVLGAVQLSQYASVHPLSPTAMALILGSFLFVAIGLGAVRAYTVRVWRKDGQLWRQGTYVTAALWIGGAAIHLLLDRAAGATAASDLLYLGLTLTAQRLVLEARAKRMAAGV